MARRSCTWIAAGGIPAVYCCFRATPRDWLRVGYALLMDGQLGDTRLWPAGWVEEMTRGSAVYGNYGYQIWVGNPPPGEPRRLSSGSGRRCAPTARPSPPTACSFWRVAATEPCISCPSRSSSFCGSATSIRIGRRRPSPTSSSQGLEGDRVTAVGYTVGPLNPVLQRRMAPCITPIVGAASA